MRSLFSVAALLALLSAPSLATADDADDQEAVKMAREHYKAGLDAYKAGNYEVAIKELKKAYLIKRLPPLLINIGATYRKMGDFDLAIHFYRKYLDEAPAEAKDRGEVENTIREIEAEKANKASAPPPATKEREEEAPRPARKSSMPTDFTHNPVDAAPPDTPLDVRVSMPVMKGVKVWLNYRVAGEADYQAVLMKRRGNEKVGRIPADAMQGKAIQYYIEAKDSGGSVVKSSGSDTSPNIVMIDPSARPQVVASYDDRGSREERVEPVDEEKKGRRGLDEEEAPLLQSEKGKKRDRGPSNRTAMFWAGLGVGIAGVALIGVGAGMGILAKQQADAVTADAAAMPPYEFKDPSAPNGKDDYKFEQDGKLYNTLAIVGFAAGGALAATGIALMIVDVAKGKPGAKKRRPVVRDEEAVSSSWYLTPVAGPQQVGLGGGFSF